MTDQGDVLLVLEVLGKPEPQGSTTAFVPLDRQGYPLARGGRKPDGSYRPGSVIVNITSDNPRLKSWRKAVAWAAKDAWGDRDPVEAVSLEVEAHFFLKRPEDHWRTGKFAHLLKDDAPAAPFKLPDVDKLLRACLDGLSGIVYKDDALVTCAPPEKHYAVPSDGGDGQGARLIVRRRVVQLASDLPPEERVRFVRPEGLEVDAAQLALGSV